MYDGIHQMYFFIMRDLSKMLGKNWSFYYFTATSRAPKQHRVSAAISMFFSNDIVNSIFRGGACPTPFQSLRSLLVTSKRAEHCFIWIIIISLIGWFVFYCPSKIISKLLRGTKFPRTYALPSLHSPKAILSRSIQL